MNNKNFETYFDCGFSKVRAGTFNKNKQEEAFFAESKFLKDSLNLELEIQKIITSFEEDTNEYIDNINLMIDSPKMFSIGISISKKLDGSKLKQANIQFLIQEAKQQIAKYYPNQNITHIIINKYKIDGVDYSYLPNDIKCYFVSLDILFICLPIELVLYFKSIFAKSNILINRIICSSYAKSINYKDNLNLDEHVSFIDIGFNKTSITSFFNDKILSLNVLSLGGNNITKDISQILKIDLEESERLKINFYKNIKLFSSADISAEILKKIIFARIEEIFELCVKSIELNSHVLEKSKIVLIGKGSKILDNLYKDIIFTSNELEFLDETPEDICRSGLKCVAQLNKHEVIMVPKRQIKQGFFEKLFHFFN